MKKLNYTDVYFNIEARHVMNNNLVDKKKWRLDNCSIMLDHDIRDKGIKIVRLLLDNSKKELFGQEFTHDGFVIHIIIK